MLLLITELIPTVFKAAVLLHLIIDCQNALLSGLCFKDFAASLVFNQGYTHTNKLHSCATSTNLPVVVHVEAVVDSIFTKAR